MAWSLADAISVIRMISSARGLRLRWSQSFFHLGMVQAPVVLVASACALDQSHLAHHIACFAQNPLARLLAQLLGDDHAAIGNYIETSSCAPS
jgi:hypothetical protein